MTDSGMTPVPTHALAAFWQAMDRALERMGDAQEIENAYHAYDPYCGCDHCPDVEDIDRQVGELLVYAALAFRDACERVQQPVRAAS